MNRAIPLFRHRILFVCLLPFMLAACGKESQVQQSPMSGAMPVKVVALSYIKVKEWDEFTGRFEASKRVEVKARVSGFVESVAFVDGQNVQKGDVLYELDKRPFEIELASAEAQLSLADKELRRGSDLAKKKSISEEQLDERLQQLQVAQANYNRAKLNLEFATVVAPISGRIDRTFVDAGNLITGGNVSADTLTTIVTIDPIYFYFSGSESEVLQYIRRGIAHPNALSPDDKSWPVFVKLQDENEYLHEGLFDFSSNSLDFNTGTTEARATLVNADLLIQPGMFGRLRIAPLPEYDAITINDEWVMSERAKKYVFVVGDENKAEKRYISLGGLNEQGQRIVRSGLTDADILIAGNLQMIQPGMMLEPIFAPAGE